MWTMKFQLLLLDANIVIYLHELGLWEIFTEKCFVTLTRTVVEESQFWEDSEGGYHTIDLAPEVESGKIRCVEVSLTVINHFKNRYGPVYFDRLDPGETESLAFLMNSREEWFISAADEIVFKTLGREGRSSQGISLEEILQKIGLSRSNLKIQFTKQFRENVTHKGEVDRITDFGHSQ